MRHAVVACLMSLTVATGAHAATRTWQGDVDTNWNTAGNWAENAVPVNGDDLVFPDNPASRDSNNNIVGLSIASVSITTTNAGADYNFTGNGITLTGPMTFSNPNSGSAGNPNWNIPLTLGGAITITSSGRVSNVGGPIALGASTLTLQVDGDLRISGTISGTGGLTKEGSSALTLTGANMYTGATQVNGGTVYVGHASALGGVATGTTFAASTNLGTTGGPFTLNEPLTFLGPTNAVYAYTNVNLAGTLAFAGTLTYNAYDPGVISGAITSTGTLVIAQVDTLSMTGNSPAFSGAILITSGGFAPSSTFPATITLQAPGSLYGYATSGLLTITGGTLAPGLPFNQFFAPAGLASSGGMHNLLMVPGAPVADYDQLQVTGAVSLGATTLNSTAAGTLPLGLSFVIILNDGADPVVGTYVGKPEGATYFQASNWWQITYVGGDGNDVVLTTVAAPAPTPSVPVPGPGALALLLAAIAMVALARRRLR